MAGFSGTSGVPKSYVDDLVAQSTAIGVWNQRAMDWTVSATSFSDACVKLGVGMTQSSYDAVALDKIATAISNYTNEATTTLYAESAGPMFGGLLMKVNNNYYAGFIMSYYSERVIAFRYQNGAANGNYRVKPI
jgi:hypothetical protein